MGRPSKAERAAITAKPDVRFAAGICRNAKLLRMSYGDYLVAVTAHARGMPEHAPKPGLPVEALEKLASENPDVPLLPELVSSVAAPALSAPRAAAGMHAGTDNVSRVAQRRPRGTRIDPVQIKYVISRGHKDRFEQIARRAGISGASFLDEVIDHLADELDARGLPWVKSRGVV